MRIGWQKELELLMGRLHSIWAAGVDTPAKRREMDRLMTLCGDVTGVGMHEHGDDPLGGWILCIREMAKTNPTLVHLSPTITGGYREVVDMVNGRPILGPRIRRPFPPREAPDAARVCIDVIKLLITAANQDRDNHANATDGDYRPLAAFPKAQREKIGKAAERARIKRKRLPNRRTWLYSVHDVVEAYGETARPVVGRRGTTKGHEGTRRDK